MTNQQACRLGMEALLAQMRLNRSRAMKVEGFELQQLNREYHEMTIASGMLEHMSRQANLL